MSGRYDAIVIGSGPGGRGCAGRLSDAGLRVAMLESELVGGECPFWACIPTKTLLRAPDVVGQARHTPGLREPAADWREISEYRDYMNSGLDDSAKFEAYSERGIEVIRGFGRLAGPGEVEVGGRVLRTERIVLATGSEPAVPDVEGIDGVEFWTNREATSFHEVPESAVVLGGGPVGLELGQILSRSGSRVTLVESAERLLSREQARVGELLAERQADEGIEVRLGASARRIEADRGSTRVHLDDGSVVAAERLVVAVGRRPRVDGIGLERAGVQYGAHGIKIDARCRAAAGVWAIGDVTGVAPFTHVAAYQSRVAAGDILGREVRADYRAIPRVVFTDPEVAAVGLTADQARDAGLEVAESTVSITEIDRTETYGRGLIGEVGVIADVRRQVLVGAWAVGPLAGEWIHTAVLAVKAEVPLALLRDTVMQFPTFSEALLTAVERLDVGSG